MDLPTECDGSTTIGAQVRYFNPPRWGIVPFYAARLHDKILIADGRSFGSFLLAGHKIVNIPLVKIVPNLSLIHSSFKLIQNT